MNTIVELVVRTSGGGVGLPQALPPPHMPPVKDAWLQNSNSIGGRRSADILRGSGNGLEVVVVGESARVIVNIHCSRLPTSPRDPTRLQALSLNFDKGGWNRLPRYLQSS